MFRELTPKDPDTQEVFNWDCSEQIRSGAGGTIAEILSGPTEEEGDGAITCEDPALDDTELIISSRLSGGTDGQYYRFTVRYRTTANEVLEHTLGFFCSNATS